MHQLCPTCHRNKAIKDPQFGIIACKPCRNQEKVITDRTYEFMPKHIKEERVAYKDQTLQPFRNGAVSREYLEKYGRSRIQVTDDEVKNAKYVWSRDLPGEFYKP